MAMVDKEKDGAVAAAVAAAGRKAEVGGLELDEEEDHVADYMQVRPPALASDKQFARFLTIKFCCQSCCLQGKSCCLVAYVHVLHDVYGSFFLYPSLC